MFIGDSYRVPGKVQITYALIALNFLSFFVVTYRMNSSVVLGMGGIIPAEWFGSTVSFSASRPPEIVTLFWSFFLHGSWLHVILNMSFLYLFGPNLEARMGRLNFLLFYLSCGGAGALLQVGYNSHSTVPIIGASGAISGLLGAYFVLFRDHFFRVDFGKHAQRDLIFPIFLLILFWLVSQILHGIVPLLFKSTETFEPIAYFAHIGGFLCGFFLARSMKPHDENTKSRFRVFNGGRKKTG